MKNNSINYKAGSIIVIPLKNGKFAAGLIARRYRSSLLGYFFNQMFDSIPVIDELEIRKENVIFIKIFGYLGLKLGEWYVIGDMPNFSKDEWRIPAFKHTSAMDGTFYCINYNDRLDEVSRYKISKEEAKNLPDDGLAGHGAVEISLTKRLT
jgi:Immunity protein 26